MTSLHTIRTRKTLASLPRRNFSLSLPPPPSARASAIREKYGWLSLGPRPSSLRARLIVRGRETLKTGKAWDETSRAHRRWVDAGSRAPRCLDRKYVYTRERSTAKLLADSSAVKALHLRVPYVRQTLASVYVYT